MNWPLVWRSSYDALRIQLDLIKAQQLLMVDREAFEVLRAERDRLVEQVDKLIDHTRRIDRVQNGLTEEERQKRKEIGPMPKDMREYFKKFDRTTRDHQCAWAKKRVQAGETWDEVWADIQTKMNARNDD